ncbi:MAG: alkaline phosphatase family protein [Synechococcus sp.]
MFIFGVSGATWKVLDPMLKAGQLPNLQKLCEQGSLGTLLSVRAEGDKHYRPQVAWPTIATGTHPTKHGVTRFFHTANDLKVPALWDKYLEQGYRIGLYGWPMTWPPPHVNGFIIPSHHGRDSQTWPPDLASIKALDRWQQSSERDGKSITSASKASRILTSLVRNGLQPKTTLAIGKLLAQFIASGSVEEKSLLLRHIKLEISTDFYLKLFKQYQPDFSSFVTFLADLSSHRCWCYYKPEVYPKQTTPSSSWLSHSIEEAYKRIDRCMGRILSAIPSDSIVAFISEHGMSPEPVSAEVGSSRYVIKGKKLAELVGLSESLEACPVARWIAFRPKSAARTTADMAKRFKNIVVAESKLPLFQVYHHRDEIVVKFKIDRNIPTYQQGDLEKLTILYEDKRLPFLEIARPLGPCRSAMHDREGVVILRGPGIKSNYHIQNSTLVDIFPTILKVTNMPSQDGLEGKVLDVFL